MAIAQCYECTSIGFDDEPGGNCSDTHPGGKVMVMMRMVIMMMKMMVMVMMRVVIMKKMIVMIMITIPLSLEGIVAILTPGAR